MQKNREVRVRIAPSPTGDPHVGTAYVALFNFVFARSQNGTFILRIEDTDRKRAKSSSEAQIESSLEWLGLKPDEGPSAGGSFGPYRQSERLNLYKEKVEVLLQKEGAYHCFCTAERLDKLRELQRTQGQTTKYDGHCRNLSSQDVSKKLADGGDFVIRLKMPTEGTIGFVDQLRGKIEINASQLDDQVLIKADGFPTYHFANVVDDYMMNISHVIRAEEWISSTPKHVILYRHFGWEEPQWVHLPLLRNLDKSKISKRKNPVSLNYYRRAGILPQALTNYLSLMGWSFGNDQEIFSINDMIQVFNLDKISLGDPVFDMHKLTWFNQTYMHKMDSEEFAEYLLSEVFTRERLKQLHPVALERMSRFEQFVDNNSFFFSGALNYAGMSLIPSGMESETVKKMLNGLLELLDDLYDWNANQIGALLDSYRRSGDWKPKDLFMTLRLVVTGRKDSPPLNESLELIGREIVRFRIRDVLQNHLVS